MHAQAGTYAVVSEVLSLSHGITAYHYHCLYREAGNNLSEDLIRDYEERWWGAARKVRAYAAFILWCDEACRACVHMSMRQRLGWWVTAAACAWSYGWTRDVPMHTLMQSVRSCKVRRYRKTHVFEVCLSLLADSSHATCTARHDPVLPYTAG